MLKQILKFHSSPHYYLNSSAKINSGELKPSEAQQPKPEVYTSIAGEGDKYIFMFKIFTGISNLS